MAHYCFEFLLIRKQLIDAETKISEYESNLLERDEEIKMFEKQVSEFKLYYN